MNDTDGHDNRFESPLGHDFELAGYRLEGGDWQDVEKGAPLPAEDQWIEIDLVTVNLDPDSEDGFYRAADILEGFDENYELGDLVDELADAYGFTE